MRFSELRIASRFHLSENILTRMVSQELSPARSVLATKHLDCCSLCRARYDRLVCTALDIVEYRRTVLKRLGPLSSARRDEFVRQFDILLESVPARPWWKRLGAQFSARSLGDFAPSFAAALIMICAGLALFLVWRSQVQAVSAAEFLTRAMSSDQGPAKIASSGVIRRRFRVKTPKKTIEHDVYRDISGRRQPRYTGRDTQDADLALRLALAGVSWDDPLSAVSFKSWRDRQLNPKDNIHSSGQGLLTISTRSASSDIAEESLTVRESDFHPVERTVDYRESGAVEISEVGLDLLSWSSASQLFFEPESINSELTRRVPAGPLLPTAAQMDETELEARLVLNQEGADTGEQIEVARDVKGVQVLGLVESEERKRQLGEALRAVPRLSVMIRSFDDLRAADNPAPQVQVTQQQSAVAHVSQLERYFVQQGRGRDDLSRISAGLFNCSLAIGRSSRLIEQIVRRFSADGDLSPAAIHARDDLLLRTVARLLDDLQEQQELLNDADITFDLTAFGPRSSDTGGIDLVRLAERNAAATKELISGVGESGRSEKEIAAELAETISQLRTAGPALSPRP
jgi:hypothetical protein